MVKFQSLHLKLWLCKYMAKEVFEHSGLNWLTLTWLNDETTSRMSSEDLSSRPLGTLFVIMIVIIECGISVGWIVRSCFGRIVNHLRCILFCLCGLAPVIHMFIFFYSCFPFDQRIQLPRMEQSCDTGRNVQSSDHIWDELTTTVVTSCCHFFRPVFIGYVSRHLMWGKCWDSSLVTILLPPPAFGHAVIVDLLCWQQRQVNSWARLVICNVIVSRIGLSTRNILVVWWSLHCWNLVDVMVFSLSPAFYPNSSPVPINGHIIMKQFSSAAFPWWRCLFWSRCKLALWWNIRMMYAPWYMSLLLQS